MQWVGATKNDQGIYEYDFSKFMDVEYKTSKITKQLEKQRNWNKIMAAASEETETSRIFTGDDLKIVKQTLDKIYQDNDDDYD